MNKSDARILHPTTQNYLRQQAIRLREQGRRFIDIAADLGVDRNTVSQWWKQHQKCGQTALEQQQRGAKYGEGRTLSQNEEATVQRLMREYLPDELEIDSALWTRGAVQAGNCSTVWCQDADAYGGRGSPVGFTPQQTAHAAPLAKVELG